MSEKRKAFEATLPEHSDKTMHYKRSGEYANHSVQNDWAVWQTAWQSSRKVAIEESAMTAESGFRFAKDGHQIADDIRNMK